jgi:multisubunit Na+/H+ antiporter MnhB subunit
MMLSLIFFVVAIGAGLFYWLYTREEKRSATGKSRLATWRLLLATLFGLVALFAGGCSLLLVPSALRGDQYVDAGAILVLGGIPFAVSAFIWWLSLRRGKS